MSHASEKAAFDAEVKAVEAFQKVGLSHHFLHYITHHKHVLYLRVYPRNIPTLYVLYLSTFTYLTSNPASLEPPVHIPPQT